MASFRQCRLLGTGNSGFEGHREEDGFNALTMGVHYGFSLQGLASTIGEPKAADEGRGCGEGGWT
jgi:hypothetical protein